MEFISLRTIPGLKQELLLCALSFIYRVQLEMVTRKGASVHNDARSSALVDAATDLWQNVLRGQG